MDLNNIASIRVYQAVKFRGKLNTFFVSSDTAQHRACKIEIVPQVGVSLQTEEDHVIVPFPNIAEIAMNTEEKTKKAKAFKDDISKPAKPRHLQKAK